MACLIDGMGYIVRLFTKIDLHCFDVKHFGFSESEHLYAVFGGLTFHIQPKWALASEWNELLINFSREKGEKLCSQLRTDISNTSLNAVNLSLRRLFAHCAIEYFNSKPILPK